MYKEFVLKNYDELVKLRLNRVAWDIIIRIYNFKGTKKRLIATFSFEQISRGKTPRSARVSDSITREMLLIWNEQGIPYNEIESSYGYSWSQVNEAAKREGIKVERKTWNRIPIDINDVHMMKRNGVPVREIAKKYGRHTSSINDILRESKEDLALVPLSGLVEPDIRKIVLGRWG